MVDLPQAEREPVDLVGVVVPRDRLLAEILQRLLVCGLRAHVLRFCGRRDLEQVDGLDVAAGGDVVFCRFGERVDPRELRDLGEQRAGGDGVELDGRIPMEPGCVCLLYTSPSPRD